MSTETSSSAEKKTETIIENLVSVGSVWAKYGLTMGKQLLEATAHTLATTAKLLDETARSLEESKKHPAEHS